MRKIHLLLLLILVLGIALAYRATFLPQSKCGPHTRCAVPLETNDTQQVLPPVQDNQTVNTPPEPLRTEEFSRRIVNGKALVLLATYSDVGFPSLSVVEWRDGKYQSIDSNYSWINSYITNETDDFWLDEDNKRLYTFKYSYDTAKSTLEVFDYSNPADIKQAIMDEFANGLFESKSFIDLNTEKNSFVLISRGGDGCGGWGNISIYDMGSKSIRDIKKLGSGCGEGSRYFTYYKKKLILGDSVECGLKVDYQKCISGIYSQDPFDLNNKDIIETFAKPYVYDEGYLASIYANMLAENEIQLSKLFETTPNASGETGSDSDIYIYNLDTGTQRLFTK